MMVEYRIDLIIHPFEKKIDSLLWLLSHYGLYALGPGNKNVESDEEDELDVYMKSLEKDVQKKGKTVR